MAMIIEREEKSKSCNVSKKNYWIKIQNTTHLATWMRIRNQ